MNAKSIFQKFFKLLLMFTISGALFSTALFGQDVKASLFKEANETIQAAKKVRADVLAPQSYSKGMEYYNDASSSYDRGKNLDDIRKKLNAANSYFKKAMDATRLAEVTFVSSIKARADAQNAEAAQYASNLWSKAEAKFAEAAGKLEDGNVNSAKSKAGEAESLYREAELAAIKANYLQETWDLLAQADKNKVKDDAPKTLQRAKELIVQAEKELNENRYDTDVARGLAQQAKYEAKHAIYLSNLFTQMKRQKQSEEDLVLNSEIPLQQIASSMDLVAELDNGYEKTTAKIIKYIHTYQDSVARLNGDLSEKNQQIETMTARLAELEGQLGTFAQKQSELQKRMDAEAKVREQFRTVEKMFTREEALVLRESNDIIMRLVGLNFASGKSTIEPQYFSLLTKVQDAINTFPGSKLVIEGHTDSYGSDETNLRLSEERANSVRQYLLANLRNIDPSQIEAVGFGESRPIANNETAEGRTKNRRIDIVIRPQLLGMAN